MKKKKEYKINKSINYWKTKNAKLTEDLNSYLNTIKELNLKNKKLKLYLNSKIIEIDSLQNKLDELSLKLENCKSSEIINLNILSNDDNIIFPISCNNNTIFVKLEEELYNEYPENKKFNSYFTVNGLVIKRFKSIQENNIKNHANIILNIMNKQ